MPHILRPKVRSGLDGLKKLFFIRSDHPLMKKTPLRAIVLDNDETTGSYLLLFAFINAVQRDGDLTYAYLASLFRTLALWMVRHTVFRPGIRALLQKIRDLKSEKSIDAVIMYTNQTEGNLPISYLDERGEYPDFLNSPAKTIAYMLECLLQEKLFDHILTRPRQQLPEKGGFYPKRFERILNLYPEYPKDISRCVFIDDYACPQFIKAEGIEIIHSDSWYCIAPYVRILSEDEIYDCVNTCFQDKMYREQMFHRIRLYYKKHKSEARQTYPCEKSIHELCDFLDYKYIYSDIFNKILRGEEKDLNHCQLLTILEIDGEDTSTGAKTGEADGRAFEGEHDDFK